jgi:OmpA-OmpF porin, OOP family
MIFRRSIYSLTSVVVLLLLAGASPAQDPTQSSTTRDPRQSITQGRDAADRPGIRNVASGQKVKMTGRVIRRDPETISVLDQNDIETIVRLGDHTSVKSKGGFLRWGKNYDTTSLVRGLMVDVEGRGNQEGQLVADKIRFDSSDLKVARTVDSRVAPVERENQRLSSQVDELNDVSRAAKNEAERASAGVAMTNDRITALDDYVVQDSTSVYFNVNSAVLSPEFRRALDELAQKAANTKGYVIEITGHADSTGSLERNRLLSQHRADAVVRYLQENHDVPLRRMITPYGYGQMKPVADNTTSEGRRQNRRVEVKILVSRGLTQAKPS